MPHDLVDERDDAEGDSPEALLQFLADHRHGVRARPEGRRRPRKRLRAIAVVGIVFVLAAVGGGVLIWGGFTHHRLSSHAPASRTSLPLNRSTTSPKRRRPHSTQSQGSRGGTIEHKKAPPEMIRVRLTAARNDSWVEIRAGGPSGRVVFDGTVPAGQSIRAAGRGRLWARFGSLGNFDLTVNGRVVHPAFSGTVDTVITAAAILPAPDQTQSG